VIKCRSKKDRYSLDLGGTLKIYTESKTAFAPDVATGHAAVNYQQDEGAAERNGSCSPL